MPTMLAQTIQEFVSSKTGIVAFIFLAMVILERVFPFVERVTNWARVARNLALSVFNFIAGPLIVIPITGFAASHALLWRPEIWSGWVGLAADVIILDLWIYAWHRANHEIPFLWRFHEVHHLDEALDATSALRFHFGEVVLSSLVRAAVIWCLSVPLQSVIVFEILVLSSALFHHSNLRLPAAFERALSFFVVTPSVHWVHHHAIRADTDSNYCTLFSVWDYLFRTRSKSARDRSMSIGVENKRDQSLAALIRHPLDN